MPSKIIQLKDLDTSPNDLLFPITTGEAVSVTYGGGSTTLQSVVDLIPGASSGGGGSTQTVTAKTIVLSETPTDYVSVDNGATYYKLSVQPGSLSQVGIVQLSDSTSLESNSTAATSSAVKSAYDLADDAIPKSTGSAAGDIIYFSSANNPTRLAKGTAGQVLTMNSGATAPVWATPAGGSSTHTLLSSTVHTDTTNGDPYNGNIIAGNGEKWTSQSFETFAARYHAVPLVGHFDKELFTLWYLFSIFAILDGEPIDTQEDLKAWAETAGSNANAELTGLGYNTLDYFGFSDVTYSEITTAIASDIPVYIIGEVDFSTIISNSSDADSAASLYGSPRFVFTPFKTQLPMAGSDSLIFVSTCGIDTIGGIQVTYNTASSPGYTGAGVLLLPRLTMESAIMIGNLPFNSTGGLSSTGSLDSNYSIVVADNVYKEPAYTNLSFGSDTTKFLRQDGTWATPSGGGGGGGDTVTGKSNVTLGTTGTAVIQVNGSDSGTVLLPSASINSAGIVQLSTSVASSSTSIAATSSAVKQAYDLADGAIPKSVGSAQGDIIYFTASGNPVRLAKGTAGQVLTMNSGATAPSWATPSGGGGGGSSYTFKYDEITTLDTTDQGYLTATVSNTSSAEKLFTVVNVSDTYYSNINNGDLLLLNVTSSGTMCPGEHYLLVTNSTTTSGGIDVRLDSDWVRLNGSSVIFYCPVISNDAWAPIEPGTSRLFSYIVLYHSGSLLDSPSIFMTWCGDYTLGA